MEKNNVIELIQPGEFKDQLTEILRQGAQTLVLQAVEAECAAFLESHSHEKLEDGRKRVVRHGHLPERKAVTGIGPVPVKVPRSRDRNGHTTKDPARFISQLLPPYVRRSKSIEMALPYLYLKGLSSKETIKRFHERSTALYEPLQGNRNVSRRYQRNPHARDISEYHVNEPAPTDLYFKETLTRLLAKAALKPDTLATLRRYVGQWTCWLKLGLSSITAFETSVQMLLPSIASCWIPGAEVFALSCAQ